MSRVKLKSLGKKVKLPTAFGDNIATAYEILQDEQTGVLYCILNGTGNGQMTSFPLLDTDGKPLIDKSK